MNRSPAMKWRLGGGAFAWRHLPLSADLAHHQQPELDGSFIVGVATSGAHHRTLPAVEASDRVGGVDDPPNPGWTAKARDHMFPLLPPPGGPIAGRL
jgi:hypothetical protein